MMNPPPLSKLQRSTATTKLDEVVPRELLVEEIFSRLPVKYVGRSRCVCKSWCYLLKDPSFLKLHLKSQPRKHLQGLDSKSFRSVHITDKGECFKQEFDFPLKDRCVHFQSFIGCIAVNLKRNGPNFSSLVLWNPITKEYNILPKPPKPHITFSEFLGFGYDSSLDDYKVLRVVEHRWKSFHQTDVYSLRSNSWKLLPNGPKLHQYSNRGCALNGCIYFLKHHSPEHNGGAATVFAFGLKDESFMELPPLLINTPPRDLNLGVLGGQLAAYRFHIYFHQHCRVLNLNYGR